MSSIIRRNYKIIIAIVLMVLLLPIMSVIIEIIFKTGNIIGTYIRQISSNGICF